MIPKFWFVQLVILPTKVVGRGEGELTLHLQPRKEKVSKISFGKQGGF